MTIELTDKEVKIINQALKDFVITLGGLHAIGMCSKDVLSGVKKLQIKFDRSKYHEKK